MDTIASELPAVLGYLALALLLAVGVGIQTLAGRAYRNRQARQQRDARQLAAARARRADR